MEKMSEEQIQIVKSTAPVLAEHGIALITTFCKKNMLRDNSELNNVFNCANQLVDILFYTPFFLSSSSSSSSQFSSRERRTIV